MGINDGDVLVRSFTARTGPKARKTSQAAQVPERLKTFKLRFNGQ